MASFVFLSFCSWLGLTKNRSSNHWSLLASNLQSFAHPRVVAALSVLIVIIFVSLLLNLLWQSPIPWLSFILLVLRRPVILIASSSLNVDFFIWSLFYFPDWNVLEHQPSFCFCNNLQSFVFKSRVSRRNLTCMLRTHILLYGIWFDYGVYYFCCKLL